jgi:hypothetical protein
LPFSSVRTITDPLNIPASTISAHLVEKISRKGEVRGFWRYRSAPITPRSFLHWCKLDSAFSRWTFFNQPEIVWNDIKKFWDSLMIARRCCFDILKNIKNYWFDQRMDMSIFV